MDFFDESDSTLDKQALVEQLNDIITENFERNCSPTIISQICH
jgi:hypothetical protein